MEMQRCFSCNHNWIPTNELYCGECSWWASFKERRKRNSDKQLEKTNA